MTIVRAEAAGVPGPAFMAPCDSERCDSVELRGVLHLGFTNATAFRLAGVVPLTHRAKYAMQLEATVALALLGLVVPRAVNAFS